MKKVLVTGGCGFIGSNLVNELERRYPNVQIVVVDKMTYAANVKNLKSAKNKLIFADINDTDKYKHELVDVDYVFHLAAESHVDKSIQNPFLFTQSNVNGTHVLLDACLNNCENLKKFVHVSTDEIYGDIKFGDKYTVFTENSPINPTSPYAASKASSDLIALSYAKTYGLPVVVTNCSNNFGARQDKTKLIPKVIKCLLEDVEMPIYNGGKNERDWLFVMDHVDGLIKAAQKGNVGERYCFGTNKTYSNLEVVTILSDIHGKPLTCKTVEDRKAHDEIYKVNPLKAQREFNWQFSTDLETNLRRTYSWYMKNKWALQ